MEIRFFGLYFTVPHKWMQHPVKFGVLLSAFSTAWAALLNLAIPYLQNKKIALGETLAGIAAIAGLSFLVGLGCGAYQQHRINTLRKQYVDTDTILFETATRKFTEFMQVTKTNMAGELILSPKQLQFYTHSKSTPALSLNSSLADIQSAAAEEVRGKTVLTVYRHEEKICFAVEDPQRWAAKIRIAISEFQTQDSLFH